METGKKTSVCFTLRRSVFVPCSSEWIGTGGRPVRNEVRYGRGDSTERWSVRVWPLRNCVRYGGISKYETALGTGRDIPKSAINYTIPGSVGIFRMSVRVDPLAITLTQCEEARLKDHSFGLFCQRLTSSEASHPLKTAVTETNQPLR